MAYIGKTPVIGNFQKCDSIAVVNGQAAYTLQVGGTNVSPQSENHMLVSLNGILQAPVDSFTVSGSTLTFASNLVTGDVIDFVMILGNVLDLGVPSDNTVSLAKLTATGTKDATTFLRGDNTFAEAGGGIFESQLLHVRDEKSSGTSGGQSPSANTFFTRTLNTVLTNEISGASLSSNQIILPSGTYYIQAGFTGGYHDRTKYKLRNITDSSDTIIGYSIFLDGQSGTAQVPFSQVLSGRFTISAQKTFELQQRVEVIYSLGFASNMSLIEVYGDVKIWKVA